jgi:hypothetical protein
MPTCILVDNLDDLDLDNRLVFYVITHDTKDYGEKHVVRRHTHVDGKLVTERPCQLCDTLVEAREKVPVGRTWVPRDVQDDPVIVESWF